jgi:hypothetical protein
MIYKKEPFVLIFMPCKNLGLWFLPGSTNLGNFSLSECASSTEPQPFVPMAHGNRALKILSWVIVFFMSGHAASGPWKYRPGPLPRPPSLGFSSTIYSSNEARQPEAYSSKFKCRRGRLLWASVVLWT